MGTFLTLIGMAVAADIIFNDGDVIISIIRAARGKRK